MTDFDELLQKDRHDELKQAVIEFTEDDYAFLEEMQELAREFQ